MTFLHIQIRGSIEGLKTDQRFIERKKERKKERKERKSLWPNTHIKSTKRFVGLSKYDYIRKMLNKNHLGKVPSKAAER